jgi:hypothetical protein
LRASSGHPGNISDPSIETGVRSPVHTAERFQTIYPSTQAAFDAIAFMSKRNGRWRGKADSVHGPSRPHYLIGSASATFMMSSGTPRACCPSGRINGCSRCPLRVHSVRIKRARKGSPYMEITPLLCIYGPLEMGAAPMTLSVRSRQRCWLASRSCVMDTGLRPVS